ncbi:MAG: SLC13 family permease [Candidatus Caenarcaniphilales bacterium]|nr:SLC13 family permease [Candidatus Caenarcaniphilales bacterium]
MQIVIILTLLVMLAVLYTNRFKPALVFLFVLALFHLVGLMSAQDLIEGFTSPVLIDLALLMIVSSVIAKTSFVTFFRNNTLEKAGDFQPIAWFSILLSTFLNNTVVTSLAIQTIDRQKLKSVLLPLSFLIVIAGTVTLVGTSSNFIVNGFLIDNHLPPLKLFDYSYVGIPLTLICYFFLMPGFERFFRRHKLRHQPIENEYGYFLQMKVLNESKLIGKSVEENKLRNLKALFLAEIIRGEELITTVLPEEVIESGDVLVFTGDLSNLQDLQQFDGLKFAGQKEEALLKKNLVWSIVAHDSPLVGNTIKDLSFRERFDATVVAVKRGGKRLSGKLGLIQLQGGDQLVLAVNPDFFRRSDLSQNFYLIDGLDLPNLLDSRASWIVILSFALAILLNGFGIVSLLKSLLGLLFLYLILGYIRPEEVKKLIPVDLILIIGSSIAMAKLLSDSGVAQTIVNFLLQSVPLSLQAHSRYYSLVLIYMIALVLKQIITNNALASLMLPIALATSQKLGVSYMPFIMAIAYVASASFLNPFSYQVNAMVANAGGYKSGDFVKLGLPLTIIYSIVVLILIPIFFKF